MYPRHLLSFFLLLSTLLITSCYSPAEVTTVGEEGTSDGKIRVTFTITQIEQVPFDNTRSQSPTRATSLSSLCTRFSLAIFQGDTRLQTVHQSFAEAGADFGAITLSLKPAEYQIVAIAHNGLGNCTISTPGKVTFKDNKLTDTFYYYGTLDLTDQEQSYTAPLALTRPVAMFRLILTDTIPSEVNQMQFYYTGGSSTFSPLAGFGCVNSRQTETFSLSTLTPHPSTFEVYTFPHEAIDFLNITISALDAAGATLYEKTLGNILVQPNVITQHTEAFFPVETPDPTDPSDPEPSDTQETTVQPLFFIYNDGQWDSIVNQ